VTQLLNYANPSPKLWLTISLKTNHHKLLSNLPNVISIHNKLDLVVISLLELHGLKMKLTTNNMHNVWNA